MLISRYQQIPPLRVRAAIDYQVSRAIINLREMKNEEEEKFDCRGVKY